MLRKGSVSKLYSNLIYILWETKYTVEPFYWGTSIQETLPFSGHYKIVSQKKVHIIFVFVTSIQGTSNFNFKCQDS